MEIKKNNTSIFIVPTLKIDKKNLDENGFINGYISDKRQDNYSEAVYLLFKPKSLDKFRWFVDGEYERTNSLVEDYDYENGYVVLVYQLNPEYYQDYSLVKAGKYSEVSEEYKNLFPKVAKVIHNGLHRDQLSLQIRVFKKTEEMKEYWEAKIGVSFDEKMEVWPGWDDSKETLDIDNIK